MLLIEIEELQVNFEEYQKKYLEANKKIREFESTTKKLYMDKEQMQKDLEYYKSKESKEVSIKDKVVIDTKTTISDEEGYVQKKEVKEGVE